MAGLVVLYEDAHGYALFERQEVNEIAEITPEVQQSFQEFSRFSKVVKLKSFAPFSSAENALENANDISEGVMNDTLKQFLEVNLGAQKKKDKKGKIVLGVAEEKLGSAIQENTGITCQKSAHISELLRAIKLHFDKFITEFKEGDIVVAQRGLAHGYSRAKVKFNIHKVDNMIIQSISLLDQLDKDLNTFSMRCREWYGWHFPELVGIVNDNAKYAQLCKLIQDKSQLDESKLGEIEEIVSDREKAQQILEAARASMGTDISPVDMINIQRFADRVIELTKYRTKLHEYLISKMNVVAPNLSTLIGEQVAARLIAHAGSLTNLAKYPASTVQILGAEKALFRALKTRGNTPKYGLIFHSSFIGRAATKNKGRISRYLANKSSLASRIDAFSEYSTNKFGERLREQVEERLKFYDTGVTPKKNVDVMHEVVEELKKEGLNVEMPDVDSDKKKKKKKEKKDKKKKKEEEKEEEAPKEKKDKKRKKKEAKEEVETPKEEKTKKSKDEKERPKKKSKGEETSEPPAEPERKKKDKKDKKDKKKKKEKS